jgi:outer membrane protein insertion porin family
MVKCDFSENYLNLELDFTNPYFYDTDLLTAFSVNHMRRDWYDFNYKVKESGGSVSLGYPIKLLDYSKVRGTYSYNVKQYEIRNRTKEVSSYLTKLDGMGAMKTSALSLFFIRDSRDNIFFPSSGSRMTLYNDLAGGFLGGDFDYFKQIAEAAWFTPLIWSTVLRTKCRIGFIEGYGHQSNELPPDVRFYLGGIGNDGIRGYANQSIAPEDGGKREMLFSTEIGIPISGDQFIGLLFIDSGQCFNNFYDYNLRQFKSGAGFGIRIRTPFGLIGFDMANNFSEKKKRWEPHFQIGTTF